jgi:hypothetical protein
VRGVRRVGDRTRRLARPKTTTFLTSLPPPAALRRDSLIGVPSLPRRLTPARGVRDSGLLYLIDSRPVHPPVFIPVSPVWESPGCPESEPVYEIDTNVPTSRLGFMACAGSRDSRSAPLLRLRRQGSRAKIVIAARGVTTGSGDPDGRPGARSPHSGSGVAAAAGLMTGSVWRLAGETLQECLDIGTRSRVDTPDGDFEVWRTR